MSTITTISFYGRVTAFSARPKSPRLIDQTWAKLIPPSPAQGAPAFCFGSDAHRALLVERGWDVLSLPLDDMDALHALPPGHFQLICAGGALDAEVIAELRRIAADCALLVVATPEPTPFGTIRLLERLAPAGWGLASSGKGCLAFRAVVAHGTMTWRPTVS
jgi:hypothetical protein